MELYTCKNFAFKLPRELSGTGSSGRKSGASISVSYTINAIMCDAYLQDGLVL